MKSSSRHTSSRKRSCAGQSAERWKPRGEQIATLRPLGRPLLHRDRGGSGGAGVVGVAAIGSGDAARRPAPATTAAARAAAPAAPGKRGGGNHRKGGAGVGKPPAPRAGFRSQQQ